MLWVVLQCFIDKHGFSNTLFCLVPNAKGHIPEDNNFYHPQAYNANGDLLPLVPKHGNMLFLQLVIQGMKLQPCSPSFFNAHIAILQANEILMGSDNSGEIWTGFAERGLGANVEVVGQTLWGRGVCTNVGLFNISFLLCDE